MTKRDTIYETVHWAMENQKQSEQDNEKMNTSNIERAMSADSVSSNCSRHVPML